MASPSCEGSPVYPLVPTFGSLAASKPIPSSASTSPLTPSIRITRNPTEFYDTQSIGVQNAIPSALQYIRRGFFLKNFVHEDFTNTSITVLQGAVKVYTGEKNTTLTEGNRIQLPFNKFHVVQTISEEPSCYMYIYVNTTGEEFQRNVTLYEEILKRTISQKEIKVNQTLGEILNGERSPMYRQATLHRQIRDQEKEMTLWETFKWTLKNNDRLFRRGCKTLFEGLRSIVTGKPFARI